MTKEIQVLDNGFVKLINYMGDDDAIANAARVSYAAGTKTKRDNEQLVRFLMRHQHYSPFGQCQVQFQPSSVGNPSTSTV